MSDSEPDLVDDDEHVGDKKDDIFILQVHPEDDQGQNSYKEERSEENTEVVSTVSLHTYFSRQPRIRFLCDNCL